MTHTPESLLAAVGVDWKADDTYWYLKCDTCGYAASIGCNCEPSDKKFNRVYTGPALGTPELDAVLLVAGLQRMREIADGVFDNSRCQRIFWMVHPKSRLSWAGNALWLLTVCDNPGHALAAAIAEVAV